jgi:hypothetical protein
LFASCTRLTNVTIPGNAGSIPGSCFYECGRLANITISGGITSIGECAFQGCTSLTTITIPASVSNIGGAAFGDCGNLTGVFFAGNAPNATEPFEEDNSALATYYLPGTTGWSLGIWGYPSSGDPPALLWNPVIQTGAGLGVWSNQFGFNITAGTNLPVEVEACTNLANPVWMPLTNVALTNGAFQFSDPQWTNYPARYYGLGFP